MGVRMARRRRAHACLERSVDSIVPIYARGRIPGPRNHVSRDEWTRFWRVVRQRHFTSDYRQPGPAPALPPGVRNRWVRDGCDGGVAVTVLDRPARLAHIARWIHDYAPGLLGEAPPLRDYSPTGRTWQPRGRIRILADRVILVDTWYRDV